MMFLIRLALGITFVLSGFEKVSGPSANFLYIIQQYQVLPLFLAKLTSLVFPWLELSVGVFLVAGLQTKWALRFSALMSFVLCLLVGQAIVRQLPIDDCGCFGELIHLSLEQVMLVDLLMLLGALFSLKKLPEAERFGLDSCYNGKK